MSHRSRCAIAAALALVVPAFVAAVPSRAFAQADPLSNLGDPVETVNAPYRSVADAQRADLVLLPAISAMDEAPAGLETLRDAVLATPDSGAWGEIDAWASADPQRAALEAFGTVTERDGRYRFAVLYGAGNIDPEIRETGAFPRLTDDRLLAGADMRHLDAIDALFVLVAVEAERLAAGGDTDGAIDLFLRGVGLSRMIADRAFFAEKRWGMERMANHMEAMRDILFRYPDGATPDHLLDIVARSSDENLLVGRILLPEADRLAALQMVRDSFDRFGQPNGEKFGPLMAVIADVDRPLARFGEASWWARVGENHAGYYDSIDAINKSFSDWTLRWTLSPDDPVFDSPTFYETLDPGRFAAVRAIVPDYDELFYGREMLRVAQQGTRTAFAVMAYRNAQGVYPKPLFAIRPRYIQSLPIDPFDPREVDPFRYFVPIRDQPRGEREAPRPHEMLVLTTLWSDATVYAALEDDIEAIPPAALESQRDEFARLLAGMTDPAEAPRVATAMREAIERTVPAPSDPENEIDLASVIEEATIRAGKNRDIVALAGRIGGRTELSAADIRMVLKVLYREAIEVDFERTLETEKAENPSSVFTIQLDDSVFVLYSVGFDQVDGFATEAGYVAGDILLWPPVISLERDRLAELGLLGD
ncbi:MAG: hypothetical protein ACF8QF_11615 [Phycisphaerales bacterium]